LYDRLFSIEDPGGDENWLNYINPKSLEIISNALTEPSLKDSKPGSRYQFERLGYFCVDTKYSSNEKLVFNRTVTLKDSWAKGSKK
jgi:glutaminyl-tRNA synthetase